MTIATVLITPYGGRLETLNIDYRNHTKHVNTHTHQKKTKKKQQQQNIHQYHISSRKQATVYNQCTAPAWTHYWFTWNVAKSNFVYTDPWQTAELHETGYCKPNLKALAGGYVPNYREIALYFEEQGKNGDLLIP